MHNVVVLKVFHYRTTHIKHHLWKSTKTTCVDCLFDRSLITHTSQNNNETRYWSPAELFITGTGQQLIVPFVVIWFVHLMAFILILA